MINMIESKMQTYEYEADVSQELQDELKKAEYKSREIKFAYKLLLIVLLPWIWLCIMSYYMIAYIDQYDASKAEKNRQAVADKVLKDMVKLDHQGNHYATLYLAEHGNFDQRSKAQHSLSLKQNEDAQYFNLITGRKYSDIPTYNLEEDHEYIQNLMKFVANGYPKAINELVRVELKLLEQKEPNDNAKKSLRMIDRFKKSL